MKKFLPIRKNRFVEIPRCSTTQRDTWVFVLPERIMFIIKDKYADLFRIINITSASYL